jgi:formate dehydrogenase subunit delta
MQTEHLITMANQIGDFFKAFPDETQAKKDIAQHLQRFWAKSMRSQIVEYIHQDGEALLPIVKNAILEYIDVPQHQT